MSAFDKYLSPHCQALDKKMGRESEGGTEGSGLPKGMVTYTETRTASRGQDWGQVRGLIWGMLTLRETLSCPKDDASLEDPFGPESISGFSVILCEL